MTSPPGLDPGSRYARERAIAIDAVRAASTLCQDVRAHLVAADSTSKADRSPVTVADLGSQALISLALADGLPGDPLMGEEDSAQVRLGPPALAGAVIDRVRAVRPGIDFAAVVDALDRGRSEGGPSRRWWTLDPVDGTKGFLRGGQYAVALALVEEGRVVLGVLGCPALSPDATGGGPGDGCLFVAERGGGAWQLGMAAASPVQRVRAADVTELASARMAESVDAGHSDLDAAVAIRARLGIGATPIRIDSQAKYALVARGEASIYLRIPHGGYRENVWDHAAGWLLATEAGATVTDVDGRSLDFTLGRRLTANRGIVAAPAALHDRVRSAVLDVVDA